MISWQHKHAEDISNTCKPAANNVRRERRHPMVRIALYCTLNKDGVIANHSRYSKTSNKLTTIHYSWRLKSRFLARQDERTGIRFAKRDMQIARPQTQVSLFSFLPTCILSATVSETEDEPQTEPAHHGEPPERLRDRRASGGMTSKRWPCHGWSYILVKPRHNP